MLHCWQKLSKSTNQRVYQDLVYQNALLLKILTSVPARPPLLFIALFTLHLSPLFERLEQARYREALVQISLSTEKKRKHFMCMSYFECISVTVSTIYCSNPKLRLCFVQNWVSLYINENMNRCAQLSRSSYYRFTFLYCSFRHLLQNKQSVKVLWISTHQTLLRGTIRRFQGFFMIS